MKKKLMLVPLVTIIRRSPEGDLTKVELNREDWARIRAEAWEQIPVIWKEGIDGKPLPPPKIDDPGFQEFRISGIPVVADKWVPEGEVWLVRKEKP